MSLRRCTRCGITEETHEMRTQYGEMVCWECFEAEAEAAQARDARTTDQSTGLAGSKP